VSLPGVIDAGTVVIGEAKLSGELSSWQSFAILS
jgi:hypothetical protein